MIISPMIILLPTIHFCRPDISHAHLAGATVLSTENQHPWGVLLRDVAHTWQVPGPEASPTYRLSEQLVGGPIITTFWGPKIAKKQGVTPLQLAGFVSKRRGLLPHELNQA